MSLRAQCWVKRRFWLKCLILCRMYRMYADLIEFVLNSGYVLFGVTSRQSLQVWDRSHCCANELALNGIDRRLHSCFPYSIDNAMTHILYMYRRMPSLRERIDFRSESALKPRIPSHEWTLFYTILLYGIWCLIYSKSLALEILLSFSANNRINCLKCIEHQICLWTMSTSMHTNCI